MKKNILEKKFRQEKKKIYRVICAFARGNATIGCSLLKIFVYNYRWRTSQLLDSLWLKNFNITRTYRFHTIIHLLKLALYLKH